MNRIHHIFTLLAAAAVALQASAQSDLPANVMPPAGGGENASFAPVSPSLLPDNPYAGATFFGGSEKPDWSRPLRYQPFVFHANPNTVNRAGFAPLAMWNGGMLTASGSVTSHPGLMAVESGRITATQTLGQLSLSLSGRADKVAYFRGLRTIYAIDGIAVWQFNDRLSLTLFGSWQSSNPFISPAMMGYVPSAAFGGYVSWDFADHFGVDAGAQTEFNPYNRHWETRPIVRPYYKTSGGNKFGIDIGGLLYETLRSHDRQPSNPTLGPPVPMGAPPVRMDRR